MCQTDLPMDMLMQPTSGKRNNFLVSLELGNLIEHHICRDSAGARVQRGHPGGRSESVVEGPGQSDGIGGRQAAPGPGSPDEGAAQDGPIRRRNRTVDASTRAGNGPRPLGRPVHARDVLGPDGPKFIGRRDRGDRTSDPVNTHVHFRT